jgi:hypothetical protein
VGQDPIAYNQLVTLTEGDMRFFLPFFLLTTILAACVGNRASPFNATDTAPANTPIVLDTPTNTSTLPKEIEYEFEFIDLGAPAYPVIDQCVELVEGFPQETRQEGILTTLDRYSNSAFYDMRGRSPAPLYRPARHYIHAINISPNRSLATYLLTDSDFQFVELVVVDSTGNVIKSFPWNDQGSTPVGWVDNQHVLILKRDEIPTGYHYRYPGDIFSIDISTGAKEQLTTHFADFDAFDYGDVITGIATWNSEYYGAIYGGLKPQIIYASGFTKTGTDRWGNNHYIVGGLTQLDAETLEVVQRINNRITFFGVEPEWSPNGDSFVISNSPIDGESSRSHQELFLVAQDGTITRLTYLTEFYGASFIGTAAWSPDGAYIAFWVDTHENSEPNPLLAVASVAKRQVTNYCIRGNWYSDSYEYVSPDQPGISTEFGNSVKPVWSPDGRYIAISTVQPDSNRLMYLIDLLEQKAYQISVAHSPLGQFDWPTGWMLPPQ